MLPWRIKFLARHFFDREFWVRLFEETDGMPRPKLLVRSVRLLLRRANPSGKKQQPIELHLSGLGVVPFYDFSDFFHFLEIFVLRVYDVDLPGPPQKIVDVGANVGTFTLRYRKLFPAAQFTCFEPVAANFGRLQENLQCHMSNVVLRPEAVSDRAGTTDIHLHPANSGSHSLFSEQVPAGALRETIALVEVNAEVEAHDGQINLLKLDCEGAENSIILGMSEQAAAKIDAMVIETTFGLYDKEPFLERLEKLGFQWRNQNALLVAYRPSPQ